MANPTSMEVLAAMLSDRTGSYFEVTRTKSLDMARSLKAEKEIMVFRYTLTAARDGRSLNLLHEVKANEVRRFLSASVDLMDIGYMKGPK